MRIFNISKFVRFLSLKYWQYIKRIANNIHHIKGL